MKIRTDFVTNSSSSSFILARKGELTEEQKNAIIKIIEEEMLGSPLLTPSDTEEKINEVMEDNYYSKENEENIKKALMEGKTVYEGYVSFEETEYQYAELYQKIWKTIERSSEEDSFKIIEGDLDY